MGPGLRVHDSLLVELLVVIVFSVGLWGFVDEVLWSEVLQADPHVLILWSVVPHQLSGLKPINEVLMYSRVRAHDQLFISLLVLTHLLVPPVAVHLLVGSGGVRSHLFEYCFRESIDSESGVVSNSPSYLWELWFFSSFFPLCSEEKPGRVKFGVFTGRCTTSEASSEQLSEFVGDGLKQKARDACLTLRPEKKHPTISLRTFLHFLSIFDSLVFRSSSSCCFSDHIELFRDLLLFL